MKYGYVPTPYSIYHNIYKLLPASVVKVRQDGGLPKPRCYWSLKNIAHEGIQRSLIVPKKEILSQLNNLLRDSVKMRMVSDVPLGVFLSGGVDSSLIAALMQTQSSRPVKTFTIGFEEDQYNEAPFAKRIAEHLGTDHTDLYVTSKQALDVIPKLPYVYDEPFADSSQIPTYLLSEMTRRHVTVSLSGDGGDEIFGGYNRYYFAENIWGKIKKLPFRLRQIAAHLICGLSEDQWNNFFWKTRIRSDQHFPGGKLHKIARVLKLKTPNLIYRHLVSQWKDVDQLVKDSKEPCHQLISPDQWPADISFFENMMIADSLTYLPDDILVKLDRASMGVSLEARAPYLDHRIAEFVWKIPLKTKISKQQDKEILKNVLYQYIPQNLIERPKMGFGVPMNSWLRTSLKKWAGDLLAPERLKREGYLDDQLIREKWEEHLSGKLNWHRELWNVLIFEQWLNAN